MNKLNLQSPLTVRILLLIGINIIIFAIFDWLWLQPTEKLIEANQYKIAQLKGKRRLKLPPQIPLETDAKLFRSLKPFQLADIVAEISQINEKNHLALESIQPLASQTRTDITIQPVKISTIGPYQAIFQFISQLPQSSYPMVLGDFILHTINFDNPADDFLKLTTTLYVYAKT